MPNRRAVDQNLARRRRLGARADLDQGALAGSVVADERDHLARPDREVGPGQRADVTVQLGDISCFQRKAHQIHSLSTALPADSAEPLISATVPQRCRNHVAMFTKRVPLHVTDVKSRALNDMCWLYTQIWH